MIYFSLLYQVRPIEYTIMVIRALESANIILHTHTFLDHNVNRSCYCPLSHNWISIESLEMIYCERRYFRAAKFLRIKPYVTFSRGYVFVHSVGYSI